MNCQELASCQFTAPDWCCDVSLSAAMASPKSKPIRSLLVLLLCFTTALLLWHHILMQPSCGALPSPASSTFLRVMVVADLHLAGPRTAWVDRVRREFFMRSVFRTAYRRLNPDALIVLGDVSDAGRKSNNAQWTAVVARFWDLVRPFSQSDPIQVVVGNHDVGDHHDPGFSSRLPRFAASFPGLDDTCGSRFTWKGIHFVSLNAMALHGDGCSVCSRVENHMGDASHSPVLLLHLPLYRADENACSGRDLPGCAPWHDLEGPCLKVGSGMPSLLPRELSHRIGQDVVSSKSSTQVLQSFRPRLVLSGHTHRWCDLVHSDGTREVTVPSLSWRNRDDPGFAFLTFYANSSFTLQRCVLARESTVMVVYILWGCTIFSGLVAAAFVLVNRFRAKSVKPE